MCAYEEGAQLFPSFVDLFASTSLHQKISLCNTHEIVLGVCPGGFAFSTFCVISHLSGSDSDGGEKVALKEISELGLNKMPSASSRIASTIRKGKEEEELDTLRCLISLNQIWSQPKPQIHLAAG